MKALDLARKLRLPALREGGRERVKDAEGGRGGRTDFLAAGGGAGE